MTLREFLAARGKGHRDRFALALGVSMSFLKRLVTGHVPVSPEMAVRIEAVTYGNVKRADLRPDIFGDEALQTAAKPETEAAA